MGRGERTEHREGPRKDGVDWSVWPDWEAEKGIVNDIMHVEEGMDRDTEIHAAMRERFKDNPWLREVVKALTDGELGDICSRHRTRNHALNFTIEDDKLWNSEKSQRPDGTSGMCTKSRRMSASSADTCGEQALWVGPD